MIWEFKIKFIKKIDIARYVLIFCLYIPLFIKRSPIAINKRIINFSNFYLYKNILLTFQLLLDRDIWLMLSFDKIICISLNFFVSTLINTLYIFLSIY